MTEPTYELETDTVSDDDMKIFVKKTQQVVEEKLSIVQLKQEIAAIDLKVGKLENRKAELEAEIAQIRLVLEA